MRHGFLGTSGWADGRHAALRGWARPGGGRCPGGARGLTAEPAAVVPGLEAAGEAGGAERAPGPALVGGDGRPGQLPVAPAQGGGWGRGHNKPRPRPHPQPGGHAHSTQATPPLGVRAPTVPSHAYFWGQGPAHTASAPPLKHEAPPTLHAPPPIDTKPRPPHPGPAHPGPAHQDPTHPSPSPRQAPPPEAPPTWMSSSAISRLLASTACSRGERPLLMSWGRRCHQPRPPLATPPSDPSPVSHAHNDHAPVSPAHRSPVPRPLPYRPRPLLHPPIALPTFSPAHV